MPEPDLRPATAGRHERIVAGPDPVDAWVAAPAGSAVAGVVLLHAWWGLVRDVTDYADRLATAGFLVIAPDLFGGATAATVAEAEALAGAADPAAVATCASAAVGALAARLAPGAGIGAVGFSFGAQEAAALPARHPRVRASVLHYGTAWGAEVTATRTPLLLHVAAEDPFEPADAVDAFAAELATAGRPCTLLHYPDTGHWFAEPSRDAYRAGPAADAFATTVRFLREHCAPGG